MMLVCSTHVVLAFVCFVKVGPADDMFFFTLSGKMVSLQMRCFSSFTSRSGEVGCGLSASSFVRIFVSD